MIFGGCVEIVDLGKIGMGSGEDALCLVSGKVNGWCEKQKIVLNSRD